MIIIDNFFVKNYELIKSTNNILVINIFKISIFFFLIKVIYEILYAGMVPAFTANDYLNFKCIATLYIFYYLGALLNRSDYLYIMASRSFLYRIEKSSLKGYMINNNISFMNSFSTLFNLASADDKELKELPQEYKDNLKKYAVLLSKEKNDNLEAIQFHIDSYMLPQIEFHLGDHMKDKINLLFTPKEGYNDIKLFFIENSNTLLNNYQDQVKEFVKEVKEF